MGVIRKRGKTWYVDYMLDGKRIVRAIGRSKRIAGLALADIEVKIAKKSAGFLITDKKLSEYIPEFLSYVKVHVKPSTAKRYVQIMGHFSGFLDTREDPPTNLSQVEPPLIQQYKLHRLDFVKAQTVNYEITCLHHFFRYAVEMKYIRSNPTQDIKKIKKPVRKAPRFLSKDEVNRVLPELRPRARSMVEILLNTGMRWGELRNLEWDDVDWNEKRIRVRVKEDWSPKGGERKVPMNNRVQQILKELPKTNNWVFSSRTGSRVKHYLVWQTFKKACQKAEIDNVSLHTLRHTFASHLVMARVDLATVSKLLGHKDISTTMIYSHLSPDHLTQAVERLELG